MTMVHSYVGACHHLCPQMFSMHDLPLLYTHPFNFHFEEANITNMRYISCWKIVHKKINMVIGEVLSCLSWHCPISNVNMVKRLPNSDLKCSEFEDFSLKYSDSKYFHRIKG